MKLHSSIRGSPPLHVSVSADAIVLQADPMFDEYVRTHVEPLLSPIARGLGRLGLTPTAITVGTFAIAAGGAAAIAGGYPSAGLALWLVSRVGDGLDGILARASNRVTAFGGYLDISLDMTAYSAMVVAFATLYPEPRLVWLGILTGYVLSITTTLALAAAADRAGRTISATNRTFQFTRGLAEGGETTLVYVAWVVFPAAVEPVAWAWCAVLFAAAIQRSMLAWGSLN
ncbi:MAG: CDP-alcohol phosphatidyltransferase family protein [Vicinamibacterales bacterium]